MASNSGQDANNARFRASVSGSITGDSSVAFLGRPLLRLGALHFDDRGFEAPDVVTIAADRRYLTFNMTASSPGNQARVITRGATTVAEPASLVLLGCGLLGLVAVRRRSNTQA
jgi:hypothetical protein